MLWERLCLSAVGIDNKHLTCLISEQLIFKPALRLYMTLYRRGDRGHVVLHVEEFGHLR